MFPGYRDAVQVGAGGLGNLYRAVRVTTGGEVAIKELREVGTGSPTLHRARRELEALLRLKGHPYVITVEEILDGPNGPCLVMEFANGGAEALARMGVSAFDVIVSDMRMPAMNGAQLLKEVAARHPRTVRFILSGQADQELILECVRTAHQFLSKPCDPETLKTAVGRTFAVDAMLQSSALKEIVAQTKSLHLIPRGAQGTGHRRAEIALGWIADDVGGQELRLRVGRAAPLGPDDIPGLAVRRNGDVIAPKAQRFRPFAIKLPRLVHRA